MAVSINRQLFTVAAEKEVNISLVKGLNGLVPTQDMVTATSITNPGKVAQLRKNIVSAIAKISDTEDSALGFFTVPKGDGEFFVGAAFEMNEGSARECAVITQTDGVTKLLAVKKVGDQYETYNFKPGHDNGVLLLASVIALESISQKTGDEHDEFCKNLRDAKSLISSGITADNIELFANAAAIVSENIYRRLSCASPTIDYSIFEDTGSVRKLTPIAINSGKYKPATSHFGTFSIISNDDADAVSEAPVKTVDNSTAFLKDRAFTEEEKRLVPTVPSWYIMPKEVDEVVSMVKATTSMTKPKRNFMFRGPSSTGKTSMARVIAAKLGLPYVYITCSADTESYAFLGQPMYDETGTVKYVESDFVKAIKNGWVVEVQEPYVIAKQGVLTALNGLLDDSAGVTLATGEFVERHPDAIVIFTTNVTYEGCRKPNQSVLRRMNNVYDVEMPSNDDIIKRVMAVTNCEDVETLSKMTEVISTINEYLIKEDLTDGVCGVSELIDWVITCQCGVSLVDAAASTIVSKATDEKPAQTYILGLIESKFGIDAVFTADISKNLYQY